MIFKKLKLIATNWKLIETLVWDAKRRADAEHILKTKDYLNLCARHQQRTAGVEYAEHNCDHCKLMPNAKAAHPDSYAASTRASIAEIEAEALAAMRTRTGKGANHDNR